MVRNGLLTAQDGWLLVKGSGYKMVAAGGVAYKCQKAGMPWKKLFGHGLFLPLLNWGSPALGLRVSPVPSFSGESDMAQLWYIRDLLAGVQAAIVRRPLHPAQPACGQSRPGVQTTRPTSAKRTRCGPVPPSPARLAGVQSLQVGWLPAFLPTSLKKITTFA